MSLLFLSQLKALLSILLIFSSFTNAESNADRVKLSEIKNLHFFKGFKTVNRRDSPVMQLQCIGGTYKCRTLLDEVECINNGFENKEINWQCNSTLPKRVLFGAQNVTCEGYDKKNDTYVLKESCYLHYELNWQEEEKLSATEIAILVVVIVGIIVSVVLSAFFSRQCRDICACCEAVQCCCAICGLCSNSSYSGVATNLASTTTR